MQRTVLLAALCALVAIAMPMSGDAAVVRYDAFLINDKSTITAANARGAIVAVYYDDKADWSVFNVHTDFDDGDTGNVSVWFPTTPSTGLQYSLAKTAVSSPKQCWGQFSGSPINVTFSIDVTFAGTTGKSTYKNQVWPVPSATFANLTDANSPVDRTAFTGDNGEIILVSSQILLSNDTFKLRISISESGLPLTTVSRTPLLSYVGQSVAPAGLTAATTVPSMNQQWIRNISSFRPDTTYEIDLMLPGFVAYFYRRFYTALTYVDGAKAPAVIPSALTSLNPHFQEAVLSSRLSAKPSAAVGHTSVSDMAFNIDGTISFFFTVTAWGVSNTSTFSFLDYQQKVLVQFDYTMATMRGNDLIEWTGVGAFPANSSAFAMGQFFYKTYTVIHSGTNPLAMASRLLIARPHEDTSAQLPTPKDGRIVGFLSPTPTSTSGGAVFFAQASPQLGRYVISVLIPAASRMKNFANGTNIRLYLAPSGAIPQSLQDYPTGLMALAGAAPAVVLQNSLSLLLELRRGSSALARGPFTAAPAFNPQTVPTAPPTTPTPQSGATTFFGLMYDSSSAGNGGGLALLSWDSSLPSGFRIYFSITFGGNGLSPPPAQYEMYLVLEGTSSLVASAMLAYNPASMSAAGYITGVNPSALIALQKGSVTIQVNHAGTSLRSPFMVGIVEPYSTIPSVSAAYSGEVRAVASGSTTPYVCAAHAGFNDATQRQAVIVHCPPNATFSSATVAFRDSSNQITQIARLTRADVVAPGIYGANVVYPAYAFNNALTGQTFVSVTLASGTITGNFWIPEKHLHADLTGIAAGNQRGASAGYGIIDTNLNNEVSLSMFVAGLRSEITKATLYNKDGSWWRDVTACFDDAICLTSFTWPSFGFVHDLTVGNIYVNITTKMFPNGALRGQFVMRDQTMSIFNAKPIELVAALSGQQANPSNPVAVGAGGSASFWILPPANAYPQVQVGSYQVLGRISVASLGQIQPPDLVNQVNVYGPAVDGVRRLLLTFSQLNGNTGLQMFNLSAADARQLMSANISISSFRFSPVVGGLVYTRPSVFYSFMSGGGAGTRTTGAGVGTALVDHFGTFHYTLLIAGLTNSVRSVKAFTRRSTTGPSVPAPVSDFFADFEGAGQAEGESRPDIPWFLGALNSQYEISASTGPMGLIQDITGPLSPSISEGFGFYHFEGVMTPTGPSEYMGFSFAYLSPVSVILYTIVIGDNDEVQTFRVMDSNSNVYFHDNFTATNNYATATINDWNSTVKNMLTMGKLWIQALDGSGSVLLQRPLRMSKRSFSAALTPATTGTGSGYAQFSLDRDGSLVYKVYMTGLLGLTTPPTLRLDAGSTSSQLFSQLSGVILLEASHGTYYAEGRLLLSDYTTHTDIYQFYQLYTSGKCSVYTTSGLALQGPLEAVNADDTGESIDLATLLTGSQVTPNAMTTSAGGAGVFEVQQDGSLHFHLSIRNPTSPIVNAYLAGPAPRGQTGPKVLDLMSYLNGFTIHGFFLSKNASFFRELLAGHYYIVVGTQTNPNGELRGQILVQRQTYTDILQPSGPITNMAGTVRFELDDFGLMHVQVVYLMGSQLSAAGQNLSSIIMTDAENTFSTDLSRYIGHSSVIRGTFQPTAQHIYALSHRRVRVNLASCSTCAATLTGTPSQFKNPVVRNGPPVIYHSLLSGASRPTVLTSATGACVFALDTNNDLHYFIKTYALDTAVSSILILNSTNQAQFAVPIANYDIGFGYVEGTFPKLSTYQLDQLNSAEWLVVVVTTGYPFGELVGSIVLDQRTETATLTSGSSSPTGGAAWATLSFDYSGGARVQWQIQGLSGPLTQANFADTQTTPIGASLLNTVVQSHSVMALYGQSPKWYPLLGRYSLQLRLGTQANPGGELNGFMRPNVTPQDLQYRALLSGFGVGTVDGSVKASATSAVGKTTFYYDGNGIRYNMALWGLSGPPKNISLYVGGPVGYASKMAPVFDFMPTFDGANANGIIPNVSRDMLVSIGNGTAYVLVTTDKYPSGEIRGNVELEFREVGVLATQASPSLSAVPTSGFVVGCRCYLTVVGLYCEVHKNNETAVITSIHVYDERSVFIADLTDIYTYFGSWFFFQANMADVANMYAGKYHLVLGTAKYPAGEIIGKIVVSRFHFTNYYSTNYHALFRGPSSRGGGFLKMNRATSFNYEYEGYIDGTMPMSCSLLLGAAETVVAQLGVNGPQLKGTAQLPDSVFSSTLKVSCRMADFTTWEGTVVLVEERFLGLLNGGGVVGSPQVTASAGIVAMQTDINRNLHYTGRTFNVSAASFGSMQMAFSDGPQFFTANATGSDSNIPISTGKRLNELYAMNTTIDVRPPSGSVGFAPILLAGRVIPFGPFQDTLNYLRGKPATTGQLNLAVTPGYFPSAIASDYQGQGGLVQLRYTRTNWQLSVSLYIGGLSNGMQQCGFWSSSGTQIIDLMPILGKGVYSGFVNRQINVYLNRQQLDMFKDNNVEFRTYSVAYSKSLGKIGSLVYNEIVNSAYSTALAATGSVKEETPNAFVGLIPDNYIFPAPSTLTYTFASGNTINNVGVFTTFPNGTLYTGWNSSYVPDYEVAPVMNVVLNLYIASKLYIQVYMTVNIEDINDHYPVFTKALNVTVNEDVGTVPDTAAITTIEVADRDSPIYGLPLVSLLNATNMAGEDRTSYFTIRQPLAGGPAGIYRAKVLDYDLPGNQWFKLDLMAIDGTPQTKDRKSTTTTIYISLRDLNDNRPMFDQKFYIAKPEETLAVGQVTLRVTATDADSTTNSQLQYSIVPTDNSPPTHFAVTTVKMGMWYISELKVNAMLDFETRRNYNLSLTAVDMGRPMLSQSVPVYIQVVNQPFKLVIQFPPPFLTVYNSTLMGNFANNNMAAFSFMTNNEDGITSVAFECRIVRSRQDCRYSRTAISACSATCGEGQRTVTLTVQSQAFPTDPSCVSKVIMEPCQDRLCPGSSTSAPLSRRRRMIPCGQDLYCEPLDLSDVSTNPFMPCITGTGPTAPSGTFTQADPADGDYTFQLRANVNITHSGTGNSFSGYSNSSLVYTIDTTKPTTTIMKSDIPLQNNYTCPDIKFTADDLVQFWCKLEYQGEMRNFTRCTSPFNPCKQPTWYGYDELRRNGLYTFSVSAVDRALNREEFAKKITYEFDTYRPLVGLVDFPPRVNTLTSQAFEVITNDTEATVSCQLNGAPIACSVGRFSVVAVEGENHLTMTAQDKAGNVAPYVDYLFFVDSKAPEVELADLNDNVFTDRKNTLLHIQSNEQLADMRCRVVAWPNSANATEKLSECCDQAFSSASAKEENCLAACKDFSATSETNLDREVCRHFLRDYSKCLENKTMAFKNNGVAGLNRLPCGLDSDYPTSPSCRNGTFPIGTRARQLGFYLFQVKTRDLNDNAQCYQAAFVYEDASRYKTAEQDANDVVTDQTCPGDGLTYIIFLAIGGGALVIALVVCFTYYCCCVDRGNPYRRPMSVGPATANMAYNQSPSAGAGQGLEVDNQNMFDDSRYGGVQAGGTGDKAGLIGSMEEGQEEDLPGGDYEALQIN